MKSEAALHEIGVMAMTAQSDPHASAAVYRQALIDICNFALQVQAGRAAALDAAPSSGIAADCWYCMAPGFLYRHSGGYNISMCDKCRDAGQAAALARSAPAETPEKAKNDEDDQARVDGVPSDRALGSTASSHEVK